VGIETPGGPQTDFAPYTTDRQSPLAFPNQPHTHPLPPSMGDHLTASVGHNFVTTTVNKVVAWGRYNSMWPALFGLACCAIEMMGTGGPKFDLARFGADRAATGFGIAIPHLHQALVAGGWQAPADSPLLLLAPHERDDATTLRVAAALRAAGVAVAIGDVAEHAGQEVRRARVVDDAHLEYGGAVRPLDAVVAALTGGGPR